MHSTRINNIETRSHNDNNGLIQTIIQIDASSHAVSYCLSCLIDDSILMRIQLVYNLDKNEDGYTKEDWKYVFSGNSIMKDALFLNWYSNLDIAHCIISYYDIDKESLVYQYQVKYKDEYEDIVLNNFSKSQFISAYNTLESIISNTQLIFDLFELELPSDPIDLVS